MTFYKLHEPHVTEENNFRIEIRYQIVTGMQAGTPDCDMVVTHIPTGISIHIPPNSSRHRSQWQRVRAIQGVIELLIEELRCDTK